jgi:hypothetical protein
MFKVIPSTKAVLTSFCKTKISQWEANAAPVKESILMIIAVLVELLLPPTFTSVVVPLHEGDVMSATSNTGTPLPIPMQAAVVTLGGGLVYKDVHSGLVLWGIITSLPLAFETLLQWQK